MLTIRTMAHVAGALMLSMAAAACGNSAGSAPSFSPTAPSLPSSGSSLVPSTQSSSITGTVGDVTSSTAGIRTQGATTITILVTGTNISATVTPGATFVLDGVPSGSLDLKITVNGTEAHGGVNVGESEDVHVVIHVHGSSADVNVTERKKKTEIEGIISSITGSNFVVNGNTITVTSDTVIRQGDVKKALADLKVGQRVHVRGVVEGTAIKAALVIIQNGEDHDGDDNDVSGTLNAAPTGTCPAITFTVNSTKVTTDSSTTFSGGACSQVASGVKVEVNGTRQSDGSIKATRVKLDLNAEVSGTVSALGGSCPSITFALSTTKVATDSSTTFSGVACGAIANGSKVEVNGTRQSDGSVKATRVSLDD